MYLAICDDDILLCANLRRKLAAFDTGGNKLLVDEYHSGEELFCLQDGKRDRRGRHHPIPGVPWD